jgi:hypothetical protein
MTEKEKNIVAKDLYPYYKNMRDAEEALRLTYKALYKYNNIRTIIENQKNKPEEFTYTKSNNVQLTYTGRLKEIKVDDKVCNLKDIYTKIGQLKKEIRSCDSARNKACNEYYSREEVYIKFYNDYNIKTYISNYTNNKNMLEAKKAKLKLLEKEIAFLKDEIANLED